MKKSARLNIFLCNFQLHYYNAWKMETESPKKPPKKTSQSRNSRPAQFGRNFSFNSIISRVSRNFNARASEDITLESKNFGKIALFIRKLTMVSTNLLNNLR